MIFIVSKYEFFRGIYDDNIILIRNIYIKVGIFVYEKGVGI